MNRLFQSLVLLLFFLAASGEASEESAWAPDCLIIGAQKGGTTALQRYLLHHPQVSPTHGEIHFFDIQFSKGASWYQRQFRKKAQRPFCIDKSPSYLLHRDVPQRVHSLYPNMKMIVMLRNPVDRAYSEYQMTLRWGKDLPPFKEAISSEEEERAKVAKLWEREPELYDSLFRSHTYKLRGVYVEQLERWFAYFPREQFLILTNRELRKNPQQTMEKVFSFLGLKSQKVQRSYSINRYPRMSRETRAELVEYYRPYNKQLEELLGRSFDWDQ